MRRKIQDIDVLELPPAIQLGVWLRVHGLTQDQLAQEAGVSPGMLTRVIAGDRTSGPVLRYIEAETGILADSWPQY